MGCCTSSLNPKTTDESLDDSVYMDRRGSSKRSYSSRQTISSGLGSACSQIQSQSQSRSIWSRSSQQPNMSMNSNQQIVRPICDDFAEQPQELERSQGYYTCSSSASTPTKSQLRRTQEMNSSVTSEAASETSQLSQSSGSGSGSGSGSPSSSPMAGNLEWEMYMMRHAQRIMPKTSSPICQRRCDNDITFELPTRSRSYHKWRNYLQTTPAHMLHNVTNIPEAIAGHFCPTDFPAFSDLEDMESAAKRYKVDASALYTTSQLLAGHTHTITTDL